MTKTELVKALESAISAYNADVPGTWAVNTGNDYVQLVWTCDAADTPEMYGDEPWAQWGGNWIIEAAVAPQQDDSGCDGYTDKHGDEVVSQWVHWNVEE